MLYNHTEMILLIIKNSTLHFGSSVGGLTSGRASGHNTFTPQYAIFWEELSDSCLAWKHGR